MPVNTCYVWRGLPAALLAVAAAVAAFGQGEEGEPSPAPASSASVTVTIDLGVSPDGAVLGFHFSRTDLSRDILVVTALNLADKDAPKTVEDVDTSGLGQYSSQLTGWFIVQQQSQELWVGLTLERGKASGAFSFTVPGLLERIPQYPPKYVLTYSPPVDTLANLAHGSTTVLFATAKQIRVPEPRWGQVVEAESGGWKRSSGNVFVLNPTGLEEQSRQITILRVSKPLADWLATSLGPFCGSFAVTTILFVAFLQAFPFSFWHRAIFGFIVVACSVMLANIGGWWPIDWQAVFFGGPAILGILVPAVVFLGLPRAYHDHLAKIVDSIRSRGQPTTDST